MDVLERARRIADDVLFPAALAVDEAGRVPAGHLDLLAAEGFYGLAAPPGAGGLDLTDRTAAARVAEELASGCLTTTFVWLQHQGAVRAAATSQTPGLRGDWLEPLIRGQRRAGVVQAALLPGPPAIRAEPVDGGYVFDGGAQWVTGWGMVDVLYTAARDPDGRVVWALLPARPGPTLRAEPLELVACNASGTVYLQIERHFVPHAAVTSVRPFEGGQPADREALRTNGSLALGVAARCAALLDAPGLAAQVAEVRAELDAAVDPAADEAAMPSARARASRLAMHAATVLTVGTGARSVLRAQQAQRLVREAMFLLVFGSRPAIKKALLAQLGAAG